ncbi:hypothetical protein [Psychromonas aquatilis]|uniref:Uncharacterized protein n=1 Tax=Psychromonas aquatilis TaxID=2005072 RepID=A0ABU9GR04_9GAMM
MKINNLGLFSDALGNEYEVLEQVTQITNKPNSKPFDGFKAYETTCGIPVNVRKDGAFVTWEDIVLHPVN